MRRMRLISTILAAGLVAAGLSPGTALAAGGPNLALGKAATASGVNGPYTAANVNDGNANSYWESPNNAFPQWVQVDLGSAVAIDQVKLKLPPATAKPSQTVAAECSLSGSKNRSGSPQRLVCPFMTAALKPPPMVVELVIG